jgi:MFS family permease
VSLQSRCIELVGHDDAIRSFSWLAAGGALVATIVQIVAGIFSDRTRRRTGSRTPYYIAGTLLAIPALVWFYFTPVFGGLVAAFLCLQFAMNVVGGPYQAVIPDFVAPARRGFASSWMAAYQSIGNALGLIAAFAIHDLHAVALAIAAPFAGSCAVTVSETRDRRASKEEAVLAPRATPLSGTLGALLLSRGLINVGFFTLLDFLLFYVERSLRVPDAQVNLYTGTLFLAFTLAAVPGAIVAARPTDRYDKRLAVSSAVCIVAVALALLAVTPWIPLAYVAAALAGIGWGAFVTADWALASKLLPGDEMATSMGIWNVATTLPQVFAPLITGPLVTWLDRAHAGEGPRAAIVVSLIEFLIGGAAIWRLPRA